MLLSAVLFFVRAIVDFALIREPPAIVFLRALADRAGQGQPEISNVDASRSVVTTCSDGMAAHGSDGRRHSTRIG